MDLTDFKKINDTAGHTAGDQVLAATAHRLATFGAVRFAGRLGGDEFIVVLSGDRAEVLDSARQLADLLRAPHEVDDHHFVVGVSIGVSQLHKVRPNIALQRADSAMYHAKRRGMKVWAPAAAEPDTAATPPRIQNARAGIASPTELQRAIDRKDFIAFAQTIVSLTDGAWERLELLVRWRDEAGNVRAPGDLVAFALASRASGVIARWVLEQAIQAITATPQMRVTINACAADFEDSYFHRSIIDAALAANLAPGQLAVELSEQQPLVNIERMQHVTRQLAEAGVPVFLDDFTAGYATLRRLHNLPLCGLKVDRAMVCATDSSHVARTALHEIGHYTRTHDMACIAEGIERPDLIPCLLSAGIASGQGYYFARPAHLDDMRAQWPSRQSQALPC